MRNKSILVLFLLLSNLVYAESFCFSIKNSNRVLMVSADRSYVSYYPINKKINLKPKEREIFDDGGESGKIDNASYFNFSSKKEIEFERIFGVNSQNPNIFNSCY